MYDASHLYQLDWMIPLRMR